MEVIVYDVNGNVIDPKEKEITIKEYYEYLDNVTRKISTTNKSA